MCGERSCNAVPLDPATKATSSTADEGLGALELAGLHRTDPADQN
jgi:hypothetical protein